MQTPHVAVVVVVSLFLFSSTDSHHHGWLWAVLPPATAFVSVTLYPRASVTTTRTFMERSNENDESDADNSSFDVEGIRQRLEALVGASSSAEAGGLTTTPRISSGTDLSSKKAFQSPLLHLPLVVSSNDNGLVLPPPPPFLTSIDRERRLAEIQWLQLLDTSNEHVSDLWQFWFHERGPKAAARLEHAQELTNQEGRWEEAEIILRQLIDEYGVYWVEPVNCLATLYYLQGHLRESERLCQLVLAIKPWHFGALSGIVLVYAGLRDSQAARQWAALRLPSLAPVGPNRRRAAWVAKAVDDARASLAYAEERLRLALGPPDYHDEHHYSAAATREEEDSWQ